MNGLKAVLTKDRTDQNALMWTFTKFFVKPIGV